MDISVDPIIYPRAFSGDFTVDRWGLLRAIGVNFDVRLVGQTDSNLYYSDNFAGSWLAPPVETAKWTPTSGTTLPSHTPLLALAWRAMANCGPLTVRFSPGLAKCYPLVVTAPDNPFTARCSRARLNVYEYAEH